MSAEGKGAGQKAGAIPPDQDRGEQKEDVLCSRKKSREPDKKRKKKRGRGERGRTPGMREEARKAKAQLDKRTAQVLIR